MKRKWMLLIGLAFVGTLLAGGAWYGSIKPRETIFVSFPESERWSYTATHSVFGGSGLAEYGIYSGLRTHERWETAAPKIERDLVRAGYLRKGGVEGFTHWSGPHAQAFVVRANHDPTESSDVTRVSITRRATVPEASRSWLRDHLPIGPRQ